MSGPSSSSSNISSPPPPSREIPGDCGLPFFGALKDRYDYFYKQGGTEEFFKSRIQKYNSTVFRCNVPPGPSFMAPNPRVIVLLDALTFPILFDSSRVEKKDVLDGTFMPSTAFFGGYRPCAFLDPSEPKHSLLKSLFISQLAKLRNDAVVIPLFRDTVTSLFTGLEDGLAKEGKANFNALCDEACFDLFFRLFCDNKSPSDTALGRGGGGAKCFDKWLLFQLAPLMTVGLKFVPNFVEDLVLRAFPLPALLAKSEYKMLYDAFYQSGVSFLDEAERVGISRDEACHNLVFLAGFNAYGGAKILFPSLMKWIGLAGTDLHRRLADEIRTAVKEEEGGIVTVSALNKMSLTKSVVYEALRIDPPVPFQYGKAKENVTVSSHDSTFLIKKGEMIFGYQPFATRDPEVFEKPEEFVADRFIGGEQLLKYVYWSNNRETENPTAGNKQCVGKDLVVLLSRLMLVEFFLNYDTFSVDVSTVMLGPAVTFTSLTRKL